MLSRCVQQFSIITSSLVMSLNGSCSFYALNNSVSLFGVYAIVKLVLLGLCSRSLNKLVSSRLTGFSLGIISLCILCRTLLVLVVTTLLFKLLFVFYPVLISSNLACLLFLLCIVVEFIFRLYLFRLMRQEAVSSEDWIMVCIVFLLNVSSLFDGMSTNGAFADFSAWRYINSLQDKK